MPYSTQQVCGCLGFPNGSAGKGSTCHAGDTGDAGLILGWGRYRCRRKWQPTPVFLPGKSHQQRSLAHYSWWGHKELGTTEPKACAEAYLTLFVHCLHKGICACTGERTWMLTSYVAWSRLCPVCPAGNGHFPWGRVRLSWSEFGVSVCLASRDGVLWRPWPSLAWGCRGWQAARTWVLVSREMVGFPAPIR